MPSLPFSFTRQNPTDSEAKPIRSRLNALFVLIAILLTFISCWYQLDEFNEPRYFRAHAENQADMLTEPTYQAALVSDGNTPLVHAPSFTELGNGNLLAVWFAGSREGAKDVKLHQAVYNQKTRQWGQQGILTSPADTQEQLQRYVRKLGNAVVTRAPDGRLWIFYVSVSMGGWATSSLNTMTSHDDGLSWSSPKRLITSPFFNLSTLVKGTPQFYQDGSIALPVYHEMAGKFGEILRLSPQGRVIDKARLGTGRQSLQPVLFIQDEQRASVLMRYCGDDKPYRALFSSTTDGGEQWAMATKSTIDNPNSALTGLVLNNGDFLAIANDTEELRYRLSLLHSSDGGQSWRVLHRFEDQTAYQHDLPEQNLHAQLLEQQLERVNLANSDSNDIVQHVQHNLCSDKGCKFQFDYPYMLQTSDGTFNLIYTWNKSYIKHIQFNQAWLEELLK